VQGAPVTAMTCQAHYLGLVAVSITNCVDVHLQSGIAVQMVRWSHHMQMALDGRQVQQQHFDEPWRPTSVSCTPLSSTCLMILKVELLARTLRLCMLIEYSTSLGICYTTTQTNHTRDAKRHRHCIT
jgi:hypothetical protein